MILDELIYMFRAKGAKEVASETKTVSKEMSEAEKEAKKLERQTAELTKKFVAMLAPMLLLRQAFKVTTDMAKMGNDFRLMAQSAGVSVEAVMTLGNALKAYGGDAASASAVMGGLNQSLQDLRMGKGGALQDAALLYGLDIRGSGEQGLATADEMLVNIAKRMESLNAQQQIDLGHRLGLDPSTIMLLQGGVKGLMTDMDKARKSNPFDKEAIENAKKFALATIKMNQAFDQVKQVLSSLLLPVFEAVAKALTWIADLMKENKAVAVGVFAAIATAAVLASIPMWSLAAAVLGVTWPIIALGAALTAAVGLFSAGLYLVIEDFVTFLQGGESAVGDLVNDFKWLWEQIKTFGNFIADFWSTVWDGILDKFNSIWGKLIEKFKAIKKFFGFGKDTADAGVTAIESTKTPLASMTSSSIQNSATNNNSNANNVSVQGITIQTAATDVEGISQDIGMSLEKQLRRVASQNYSGVMA